MKHVALAALTLVLASPALAARADDKPAPTKIKTVDPAEGHGGTVITITGSGFTEKREDIEVLVGTAKVTLILQADAEHVRFIIPAQPAPTPGKTEIRVSVKGGDTATAAFKVTEPPKTKEEELKARDKDRIKYEGGGKFEDPYKQNATLLNITKLEITGGGTPQCIVEGETSLPPVFFLTVVFGFAGNEEKQIEARKVMIKGNTWKVIFGPYTNKVLLAGKYFVNVAFEMSRQSPLDLKKAGWPDKLSEGERTAREYVWRKEIRDIGTPAELKKQEDDIRGHYVELATSTTKALDTLERAYCAAGKSYFKKQSSNALDEEEWTKWVQTRGITLTDADVKKIKDDNRFLKGAFFSAEGWELWLQNDLFKTLAEILKRHNGLKERYVGARDERIQVEGDYLISCILRMAQRYSAEIYERNKLPIPETLRAPKDLTTVGEAVAVSRGHFEGHRKIMLERLGLANFDPTGKTDKPGDKKDDKPADKKDEKK